MGDWLFLSFVVVGVMGVSHLYRHHTHLCIELVVNQNFSVDGRFIEIDHWIKTEWPKHKSNKRRLQQHYCQKFIWEEFILMWPYVAIDLILFQLYHTTYILS